SFTFSSGQGLQWVADDGRGGKNNGTLGGAGTISLPLVSTLNLTWTGFRPPTVGQVSWYDIEERIGVLPSVFAHDPGAPEGPPSVNPTVVSSNSPTGFATATLDWSVPMGADGTLPEGGVVAYQIGHRFLGDDGVAPDEIEYSDLLYPLAPIYL